jgi:hypothetical protein
VAFFGLPDIFNAVEHLKLGQGFRGRLPDPDTPRGLPAPMGGIPHIRQPQGPRINMGAVAQAGRQARMHPFNLANIGPRIPGLIHAPGFGAPLPKVPKLPKLGGAEAKAMNVIRNAYYYKDPGLKINNLIAKPTPAMQTHINSNERMQDNHQLALKYLQSSKSWLNQPSFKGGLFNTQQFNRQMKNLREGKWGPGTGVTAAQAQDYATQRAQEKASQRGFGAIQYGGVSAMGVPVIGSVLGKTQQISTEAAGAAKGLGPALYGLGEHGFLEGARLGQQTSRLMGMKPGGSQIPSQAPYFGHVLRGIQHSYGETIHHPIRQWQQNPFGLISNVLPVASAGAGAVLKAGSFADIMAGVSDGTISPGEATLASAKLLVKPHGIQRRLGILPADKHFDFNGIDRFGFDKGDYAAVPGEHIHPQMPIWADVKNPERSLLGPPGLDHGDIPNPKGLTRATAHIDENTGRVGNIELHGKPGNLSTMQESLLHSKLMRVANQKLEEANRFDPYAIQLPAAKSALGALIQTKLLDPLTVRALSRGVRPTIRAMGQDFEIPQLGTKLLQGRYGKLIRRDLEMQMQGARGAAEVRIAHEMGLPSPYGPAPQKIPNVDIREQIHPGEVQRLAYGQGAAKVHADEWHNLYEGLMGPNDRIMSHLDEYVAIKKPPSKEDILKNAKAYNSEKNVGRQWDNMIQTDHEAIRSAPGDYAYIPKRTWNQMRFKDPSVGRVQAPFDTMDNVTQIVRSGRFMHPGYIAWALQNGILHLSQAGALAFRNAMQLHNEWGKMPEIDRATADNYVGAGHFGGGIARASSGSEGTLMGGKRIEALPLVKRYKGFTQKAARFWHAVDDAPFRRMSLIHELNRYGYHTADDWSRLLHTDPAKFRMIARQAQRESIDYSEMSPLERATMQKMFTAWGWTRGATTYTGRFPFQHPIQYGAAANLGQQGQKAVEDYYMKHGGGLPPDWLSGYLPMGKGDSPWMLEGGVINPAQTAGELLGMIPAATKGQTESLAGMESPGLGLAAELGTGLTKYGQQLKGNQRLTQPFKDLISRFEPYAIGKSALESKKGGGTFMQGLGPAALSEFGVPLSHLRSTKEAGALGVKDFEQMLAKPDEINFRYNRALQLMPQQAKQLGLVPKELSSWRNDLEMVRERDQFLYQYAQSKGANSVRSLPPINAYEAAIAFQQKYMHMSPAAARAEIASVRGLDDTTLKEMTSAMWTSTGIGAIANAYTSALKATAPLAHTPGR